jgi:glycosyltransferase involved in cell wall biosynthesis
MPEADQRTEPPAPPGSGPNAVRSAGRATGEGPGLRVLLFSPLAGVDPPSGDTSYTEALLADPPPGVRYTDYRQAIEAGTVRVRGRKPWRIPRQLADVGVFGLRLVELGLRRCGVMFREPTWFVTVDPDAFDLVHQHLFALRQIGPRVPVVSGAGYPLSELYQAREGWSPLRARLAVANEALWARLVDVHVPWLRPVDGGVMTVYSEHFRRWLIGRGVRPDRVLIAGTALPPVDQARSLSDGRTLGFVGRDFQRKGGDIALEAFRQLRQDEPDWRMVVVTDRPHAALVDGEPGVEVLADPPREVVLGQVLPSVDVLLCPTRSDCGAPYAVLEALQSGTAVVASTSPWLDERLRAPAVVRVPAEADAVAGAVRALVAGGLGRAQDDARRLWSTEFSMASLHRALRTAYGQALQPAAGGQDPAGPSDGRPQVLVLARPFDLSDAPFDGFVHRHRRMVAALGAECSVSVLLLGEPGDATPTPAVEAAVSVESMTLPARRNDRAAILGRALRNALGQDNGTDRELRRRIRAIAPDLVVAVGPWLGIEYRGAFRSMPTVYLFEEDLTQMSEIASQSWKGRTFRAVETWINARARWQPEVVVSISRAEQLRAARRYPRSRQLWVPFTLPGDEWPLADARTTGPSVLAVGNFSEPRNSEGLVAVLDELDRRPEGRSVRVRIVSDAGLHPSLLPFLDRPTVEYPSPAGDLRRHYDLAWAALVPALRVTGQKTTILQAWACGCPVVCSSAAAATVQTPDAVASGRDAAEMVDQLLALRDRPERGDRLVAAGFRALAGEFDPARQDRVLTEFALEAMEAGAARRS